MPMMEVKKKGKSTIWTEGVWGTVFQLWRDGTWTVVASWTGITGPLTTAGLEKAFWTRLWVSGPFRTEVPDWT